MDIQAQWIILEEVKNNSPCKENNFSLRIPKDWSIITEDSDIENSVNGDDETHFNPKESEENAADKCQTVIPTEKCKISCSLNYSITMKMTDSRSFQEHDDDGVEKPYTKD